MADTFSEIVQDDTLLSFTQDIKVIVNDLCILHGAYSKITTQGLFNVNDDEFFIQELSVHM